MNSKQKGNRGELELLHILQRAGIKAERNQQMYIGGMNNPDILAHMFGRGIHIEVKRKEKLSVYDAMKQAVRDSSNSNALPMVMHRRNNEGWLCIMRLEDILPIILQSESNRTETEPRASAAERVRNETGTRVAEQRNEPREWTNGRRTVDEGKEKGADH